MSGWTVTSTLTTWCAIELPFSIYSIASMHWCLCFLLLKASAYPFSSFSQLATPSQVVAHCETPVERIQLFYIW